MKDDVKDAHCTLCSTYTETLYAAQIMHQKRSIDGPQVAHPSGLIDDMKAAGLANLYDTCNGVLLCDQCHDFFDEFLWSVDSEGKVVVSAAFAASVPSMARLARKVLFPDDPAPSLVARANRPLTGVWAWHFKAFSSKEEEAALELFECGRCTKRYATKGGKDNHEATCTDT